MSFSLSDADPLIFAEDGGVELQIEGVFELENPYRVYVGSAGTTADPVCQSGKAGQGQTIYPWTSTILRCYSPEIPVGTPNTITVVNQDTAEQHQLVDVVTILPKQYQTAVYSLRKSLPPYYKVGPRKIDLENN